MNDLTPLLRRVLATLPRWHEDEAWLVAEEGGPDKSVRRHSLAEMHTEMALNPHAQIVKGDQTGETRPMTVDEVERCLDFLVRKGWAAIEEDAGRYWRMTKEGFEALHAPGETPENVVPGPVEIKPDPAEATLETQMGA
jgi:hypothetical protein